jgi:hypothetical protein
MKVKRYENSSKRARKAYSMAFLALVVSLVALALNIYSQWRQ